MLEIINVQVGRCGNRVGAKFWQAISNQHKIDLNGFYYGHSDLQLERISTYYNEDSDGKYIPRNFLIDLQPTILNQIITGHTGKLFNPQNFIVGQNGASNNWAKGHYTEGAQLIDQVFDAIRIQVERCDCLQGFQITHSLGGGTGSGMGTLLISKLKQEYYDKVIETFSVVPSPKWGNCQNQYYSAILSFNHLIELADDCVIIDNEALYDICFRTLKLTTPTYSDLNHLACTAISGVSCYLRFPSQINYDIRRFTFNLIPFPRLHFLTIGMAPIVSSLSTAKSLTIDELSQQMFDAKNLVSEANPNKAKYFGASVLFRGLVSAKEVGQQISKIRNKHGSKFVEWSPDNIKSYICDIPPKGLDISATIVRSSTDVQYMFKRISESFEALFRRKAFLHWYTSQGMDQIEFAEAQTNTMDLIQEYQYYQNDVQRQQGIQQ